MCWLAEDELNEAEDQLDKARARREDAMKAMRADVEALGLQVSKLDAKRTVAKSDNAEASRLHALRESVKGEIAELEVVITGKAQLEESLALLNKARVLAACVTPPRAHPAFIPRSIRPMIFAPPCS